MREKEYGWETVVIWRMLRKGNGKRKKRTKKSTCPCSEKEGHLSRSQAPTQKLPWSHNHGTHRGHKALDGWVATGLWRSPMRYDASDHLLKAHYAPVYTHTTYSIASSYSFFILAPSSTTQPLTTIRYLTLNDSWRWE